MSAKSGAFGGAASRGMERADVQLAKLQGFETIVFSSTIGKIDKSKYIIKFDKAVLDPFLARMYSTKPALNRTLHFVPKNIIGYQWSLFEPGAYWKYMISEAQSFKTASLPSVPGSASLSPETVVSGIEQVLGVSIERDIIPALGNEVGGFLSDIDVSGLFPIPKFVAFVQVKDAKVMGNVLGTISQRSNLSMQSNTYKQVSISYVSLPFGSDVQPAYCFLDGYLLIATSGKLLESCIDSRDSKTGTILADSDFQMLDPALTGENNSVFFLKTALLVERLKDITAWALRWAQMIPKQVSSQNYREELQRVRVDLRAQESELVRLRTEKQGLKDVIVGLVIQGADVSSQEDSLDALGEKIAQLEGAVKEAKAHERDLSLTVARAPRYSFDASTAKLYAEELIYPLLEGFSMIKAMGSRSIFKEDRIEIFSYCMTEK